MKLPKQLDQHQGRLEIVGAGPAGLAAAIAAQKAGVATIVYEKNSDVGNRFHGDFQGLENWTTERDVLEEFTDMGFTVNFDCQPVREFVCFDPAGREYVLRGESPVFYLVRRGTAEGTLDQGLKKQAQAAGVDIRYGVRGRHLRHGGIVAEGPHGADAIAAGYVFNTDMADGCYTVIAERLAPRGYGYLLIHGGRGTLATCLFADFHNEREYVERTVAFFREQVGLRWSHARRFGGAGHFALPGTARRDTLLYAGESAGFQDALFGFGLRYAVTSGYLAARAVIESRVEDYDGMWQDRFGTRLRTGAANRRIYGWLGDRGYRWLLARQAGRDPRHLLHRVYAPRWWKDWLARGALRPLLAGAGHAKTGCDCTWCRCRHIVDRPTGSAPAEVGARGAA